MLSDKLGFMESAIKPFIGGFPLAAHNALDDADTCGKLVLMAAKKFGCANIGRLLTVVVLEMSVLGL
jgi:hypothetical protein